MRARNLGEPEDVEWGLWWWRQRGGNANGGNIVTRRLIVVQSFSSEQRRRAKPSFATRRVPEGAMRTLIGGSVRPRSGDLVLASVSRLGQHRRIEQPDGRRATLYLGDEVIVAYGDRYAPDQFEAEVPSDLGRTHLVASGGIASSMLSRSRDVRNATDIVPVGLIGDERGRPINLADFSLEPQAPQAERPRTIAVLGTSMNSGKTTTVQYLVRGLSRGGFRPGATKVTGTGSGNDYWVMLDAGAHRVLDFTDVGLASTYRQSMPVLEGKFVELVDHLTASGSGVNLIEVADGLFQRETAQLIESEVFQSTVDAVVFAAPDSLGAAMGVNHLRSLGVNVIAVSGRLTRSPLQVREAQVATELPILGILELSDLETVRGLLGLDGASLDEPLAVAPAAWPDPEPGPGPAENGQGEYDDGFLARAFVGSQEVSDINITEQR